VSVKEQEEVTSEAKAQCVGDILSFKEREKKHPEETGEERKKRRRRDVTRWIVTSKQKSRGYACCRSKCYEGTWQEPLARSDKKRGVGKKKEEAYGRRLRARR